MMPQRDPVTQRGRRRFHITERYLRLTALVSVILVIALIFTFRHRLPSPETVAYPAVFLLSFIGSASVVIPVPGILSVCSGGALLNPLFIGLVAGVAEAMGESTGYLAGYSGRGMLRNNRMYQRIQPWMQRRGWIAVLVFSAVPNPLFDLVGVAAGATHTPLWQFFGAAWIGKTVKSTAVAYVCALGYDIFLM